MEEIVLTKWNGDMSFTSEINNFQLTMDSSPEHGGKNKGPNPKPLLLSALAGCTGMDVVSILGKMRLQPDDFRISVNGNTTEDHPKYYYKIHVIYEFWGQELPKDMIEKAISLSVERYCGVHRMLEKSAEITWELILHK